MSPLRFVATAGLSAVVTFLVIQAAGCGTKAVGIGECREIEDARCEAAAHCGEQIPVDDVEACKRFYRDQCLHGLAVKEEPSSSAVRDCVAAITSAGNCARDQGADTPIAKCDELAEAVYQELETVCDVIERPQNIDACFFLNDSGDEPSATGGQGGATSNPFGGNSAGTEGAAGNATAAGTGNGG